MKPEQVMMAASRRPLTLDERDVLAWWVDGRRVPRPRHVSPVLAMFAVELHEQATMGQREELMPIVARLARTADDRDPARGVLMLSWLIRRCLPAWLSRLSAVEAQDVAAALAGLPELDEGCAPLATGLVCEARDVAWRLVAWPTASSSDAVMFVARDVLRETATMAARVAAAARMVAETAAPGPAYAAGVDRAWHAVRDVAAALALGPASVAVLAAGERAQWPHVLGAARVAAAEAAVAAVAAQVDQDWATAAAMLPLMIMQEAS